MGVGGQHHALPALPPGKTRYPLYRRLGGPQGRSGRLRKTWPPPAFDTRTVQPIASRYTDWATPALIRSVQNFFFSGGWGGGWNLLGCITIRRICYSQCGTVGCAAGFSATLCCVLYFHVYICVEDIAVRNDGKDLEGYSRDFRYNLDLLTKQFWRTRFCLSHFHAGFLSFSSLLLRAWLKLKKKKKNNYLIEVTVRGVLYPPSQHPYTSSSCTLTYVLLLSSSHYIRTVTLKNNDAIIFASDKRFGLMYGGWRRRGIQQ